MTDTTIERLRQLAGEPELVIDEGLQGQQITATSAMHLLERAADVLEEIEARATGKVDLTRLGWGERVRVACGATGRYLGEYCGRRWALWVSPMDNDLMLDDALTVEPPHPDLPVPADRAMGGAAAVLRTMSARGVRFCDRCGRRPVRRSARGDSSTVCSDCATTSGSGAA